MKIQLAGENSFTVYFGDVISAAVNDQVQRADQLVRAALADALIDTVPAYASLLVIFDVYRLDFQQAQARVEATLLSGDNGAATSAKRVELPVYYGAEAGVDLAAMAQQLGLSVDTIINLHQAEQYRVYAIGFAPGFAYMGQVDERIACSRLATPRLQVPKGAVAIADRQTAVYPAASPGGWNIIGNCPVAMFTPSNGSQLMPLAVGDTVQFKAIDRDQFVALGGQLDSLRATDAML